MAKFKAYHDTGIIDLVEKISSELETFGLTIVDRSEEGQEFVEWEIVVLK